ncbi:MAG: CinA family protein [Myxococcaceae bacterium]|nr:MAG: CinA family protein [Myxococcaceae bacterium]
MSDLEALAPRVIARCREAKVRLVLAEACTGGLIAAALTDVPGASAVVERSWADWGVAETGIAGPGGGTEQKPVGLVFIAVQRRGQPAVVERHLFTGDRRAVRQAAAARGLALLLEQLAVES